MATLQQLQTWLDEAEAKRHTMRIDGLSSITVGSGNDNVARVFDLAGLDRYIAELRQEIAKAGRATKGTRNWAGF